MPSLSKLIGRKHYQTQTLSHTNLHRALLLQNQHQQKGHNHSRGQCHGHEDSGSITNSFIYTSNTTASTALEGIDDAADGNSSSSVIPPENRITLPHSLMSVSPSSSISSSSLSSLSASSSVAVAKPKTKKKAPALPVPVRMDLRRVHAGAGHHHPSQNNGHGCVDPSHCSILDNSFQNLTHLDISGNSAEKLDLRSLTRLEWLCCSNNNLDILVLSGISLTYLDCSHNNLQCISIDPLPNNLSTLQVSFNNLEELPVWTWIVPELFTIYASNNHLRQIDCKFQNSLSQLPIRELYVYSNKIEYVSKDFVQRATRLKVLNLSQNLIEHMPNFGKNSRVQELYLSRNQLQDSEDRNALEFLYECSSIKRLHLGFNKIQHIHERCLVAWKNVEELILCGNRIRSLPSKLSTLPNLRVLRVHSNQLENVPNLTKLPTLKVVDLSHNNLRKINLEDLIVGGHLTYLDISCNEKLSLNLENFHSPKRPMNLIEVTNARKSRPASNGDGSHTRLKDSALAFTSSNENDVSLQPSIWDLGFSELPDKNQILSVAQYRDVNLSNGNETLFGLFDSGDGNPAPKSLSKSIAKIYVEEKTIDQTPKFSLKYTLLNALNCMFDADRNSRQQGNTKPMQGVLCLLSMPTNPDQIENEDPLLQPTRTLTLNLAMIGNVRCILVEAGKKVKVLTESSSNKVEGPSTPSEEVEKTKESSEDKSAEASSPSQESSPKSQSPKVIQDPVTISVALTRSTEFLVVANQNVWNYINDKELVDELDMHRHKKSVLISKRITDMAQSHSCKESLSLILVRFKWNSLAGAGTSKNNLNVESNVSKVNVGQDSHQHHHHHVHVHGPTSYFSHRSAGGSSDGNYSDELTNPLASVTTPDSAIDTDNRSSRSSGSGSDSNKSSAERRRVEKKRMDDDVGTGNAMHSNGNGRDTIMSNNDDIASIANSTSPSQMSVEQFRCWEYMLEQNTRLLFKKELDSLSKATFARNQKQRKSVHFPFKQVSPASIGTGTATHQQQQRLFGLDANAAKPKPSKTAGFFTLSKAKSLSHLIGGGSVNANSQIIHTPNGPMRKTSVPSLSVLFRPNPMPMQMPAHPHPHSHPHYQYPLLVVPHMFNANNSGMGVGMPDMGGQLRPSRGQIIGGPNAAYFGSVQRLMPTTAHQVFYEKDEIQEMKNLESIEHDNHRLKKYWDDKITEL